MKNRIKEIRKDHGLTQVEFGTRIGVKGNTITNYETGLRTPTDAVILSICREFDVNKEWLKDGIGEKYNPVLKSKQIADMISDVMKADDENFKRRLISALARLDDSGWDNLEKLIDMISGKK